MKQLGPIQIAAPWYSQAAIDLRHITQELREARFEHTLRQGFFRAERSVPSQHTLNLIKQRAKTLAQTQPIQ